MLNALFMNTTMIIAFITLAYLVYINENVQRIKDKLLFSLLTGALGGLVGILLMNYSYRVSDTLIIDFRNFTLMISALFGGIPAFILTTVILMAYRLFIFGITPVTGTFFVSILLIGFGTLLIKRSTNDFRTRWIQSFFINMLVSTVFMFYWLHSDPNVVSFFANYYGGSIVLAYLIYHVLNAFITRNGAFDRLSEASTTDFLTKLNNVRGFDDAYNKAMQHCIRRNERLSFLMLDIDFFKKINDTYGHTTGDEILAQLSQILLHTCRPFDIVSRNGGEEFSVILQDCPSNHAYEVAERIRHAVESNEFMVKSMRIKLTISIGVSSYPEMTDNPDTLIEYADQALYMAKQSGRNKVIIFNK